MNNEKISFKFNNLNQAIRLVKNKNLINQNVNIKLKKISNKILAKTKFELLNYVQK